jgi:hypothetical protein
MLVIPSIQAVIAKLYQSNCADQNKSDFSNAKDQSCVDRNYQGTVRLEIKYVALARVAEHEDFKAKNQKVYYQKGHYIVEH